MILAASSSADVLVELGAVLVVLAALGRLAAKLGLPSIPLYLLAGLLLGEGSAIPLDASQQFVRVAADIGVVLLLLLLGLEYTPSELQRGVRDGWTSGALDLAANAAPGFAAGLLLGWTPVEAAVLAGVCYISSSGIIAQQLLDLNRIANRETPAVLTVLVLEDLMMVIYLPLIGVLLTDSGAAQGATAIAIAFAFVATIFLITTRYGTAVNRVVNTESPELLLLTILGITLMIGGFAERIQVSAAVTAFLVGLALADQVAERGRELLLPIRDVFGGLFFVFFGLQVDPATLPPVAAPALLLALIGALTKYVTGSRAAQRAGVARNGRIRAGLALIPRGEFSIVIAGLAVAAGAEPRLGPFTAAYVLTLAIIGTIAIRYADHLTRIRQPVLRR